jgi:hypothetical protein
MFKVGDVIEDVLVGFQYTVTNIEGGKIFADMYSPKSGITGKATFGLSDLAEDIDKGLYRLI